MPIDWEETNIQNEIADLRADINFLNRLLILGVDKYYLNRIRTRLSKELERQHMRLKAHRQKVKDSGIKY